MMKDSCWETVLNLHQEHMKPIEYSLQLEAVRMIAATCALVEGEKYIMVNVMPFQRDSDDYYEPTMATMRNSLK